MNFAVIGGDLRLSNLAQMLAKDGNEVYSFAMENSQEINENKKIVKCENIQNAIDNSKCVIGSIPFTKGNSETYAVFSNEHIYTHDFTDKNYKNKIFIAGAIKENDRKILEKSYGKVIDIMKTEELTILNTIATAEGAIDVAIQNTDKILHGSKILVLGFGRVAKIVANKFNKLSCDVTCAARKDEDLAWAIAYGYKAVNVNELGEDLKKYDIIINTVPQMIIDKNEMKYMNKNVLIIDLASTPGGVNTEDANKMKLKFVWALGLPGKVAPVTSAEFIKDAIYSEIDKISLNKDPKVKPIIQKKVKE